MRLVKRVVVLLGLLCCFVQANGIGQVDNTATRLHKALLAAGIPIDGVSIDRATQPPTVRVVFKPEATDQQRTQAQAIIDAFDFRRRRPRSLAALAQDVTNLSAADRTRLQVAIAAQFLQQNPQFARDLGIGVDGDEPDN